MITEQGASVSCLSLEETVVLRVIGRNFPLKCRKSNRLPTYKTVWVIYAELNYTWDGNYTCDILQHCYPIKII